MQTQTHVTIRPFTPADYDDITRLFNATFSEFQKEPSEMRFNDEHQAAYIKHARWIAELDGKAVAFAGYSQHAHIYHPRRFTLELSVDPAHFLSGIGRRLYDLTTGEVLRHDPLSIDDWSREDMSCRVGFLERRGFVADMRMWVSTLDLFGFDPSRFSPALPEGVEIKSLAELGGDDPVVLRKVYELWNEVRHDVPAPPGAQRSVVSYEEWYEHGNRPSLWPEGYFIAIDRAGGQFVAESQLWLSPEPDTLRTGLTATRRSYRRRGLALALKVHALAHGKAHGYHWVNTENESNNVGMLAINDQLGFVRKPAWLHFSKTFRS